MWKFIGLLTILMAVLPLAKSIVGGGGGTGRDVVLTPKQGLQLPGKRLYYKEEREERQDAKRPWERPLKHVTYVTLFTNAAIEAAAGNLSQLHQYHEFLQTPYVAATGHERMSSPSRFGDIVTLASGRLEQMLGNASQYRFMENGGASVEQAGERRALWQVQRIRHRDGATDGRYHYEIKFSVTPLTRDGWSQQSYIQKEDDYPQSFSRLVYNDKREQLAMAQRRQDRDRERGDRPWDHEREQSQATFVHGIFQAAPPPPPPPAPLPLLPPKLNIGEYLLKGLPQKGSSKIELFPGLFNLGLRQNYITPTTFRPNYSAVKFSNPHAELERFPLLNENNLIGNGNDGIKGQIAGAPITHHFHHHFYTAPGGSSLHEGQLQDYPLSTPPPPPTAIQANFYHHQLQHGGDHQIVQFPSSRPSSSSSESLESGDEAGDNLHPSQIYGQASKYQQANRLPPLLIYAGGGSGSSAGTSSSLDDENNPKQFVQSEPLEESIYRYSEPDPLYVHQNPVDVLPENYAEVTYRPQQEEEEQQEDSLDEQRLAGSQKETELAATTRPTTTSTSSSTTTTTTTTTTTPPPPLAPTSSSSSFVSTSTSFSPLRSLSRYRTTPKITAGKSTTTTTTSTESPLAKWSKRRKEQLDSKAKHSYRHESKVAFTPTAKTTTTTTTTTPTTTTTESPPGQTISEVQPEKSQGPREIIEVLTQKSVSRSVSIKVGENGEEIPIFVDDKDEDEENEVKPIPNT